MKKNLKHVFCNMPQKSFVVKLQTCSVRSFVLWIFMLEAAFVKLRSSLLLLWVPSPSMRLVIITVILIFETAAVNRSTTFIPLFKNYSSNTGCSLYFTLYYTLQQHILITSYNMTKEKRSDEYDYKTVEELSYHIIVFITSFYLFYSSEDLNFCFSVYPTYFQ